MLLLLLVEMIICAYPMMQVSLVQLQRLAEVQHSAVVPRGSAVVRRSVEARDSALGRCSAANRSSVLRHSQRRHRHLAVVQCSGRETEAGKL